MSFQSVVEKLRQAVRQLRCKHNFTTSRRQGDMETCKHCGLRRKKPSAA